MKKKLISILIVVLIIVLGFILFSTYWPKPTSHFVDKAIEMRDASVCLEIETEPSVAKYPMECFKGIADITNDTSICRTLDSEIERNNCFTGIISIRAEFYDEILCDSFTNPAEKNYCYLVTAIATEDSSFCDNINDLEEANNCKDNIK